MIAELAHVPAGRQRWWFALGAARAVACSLVGRGYPAALTAAACLAGSVAATLVVHAHARTVVAFVAVFGGLLSGYAALIAGHPGLRRIAARRWWAALLPMAGVGGTIAAVILTAVRYPTATTDTTHLFSIVLALLLTGYTVFALTPPAASADLAAAWWGAATAVACTAAWLAIALTHRATGEGLMGDQWAVGLAVVVAGAFLVAVVGRDGRLGARAGVLAALTSSTSFFIINMVILLGQHSFRLTDPYDIAQYPHSGAASAAAYVIGDDLGGLIITGLFLFPGTMAFLGFLAAHAGAHLARRPSE
jgi:hypothetical protein